MASSDDRVYIHNGRVYFSDPISGGPLSCTIEELGGPDEVRQLRPDREGLDPAVIANARAMLAEELSEDQGDDGLPPEEETQISPIILPSDFAKALLESDIREENLYLSPGGATHFEKKIVGYKPRKKEEPWNGISPYPFPHIDSANIDHNLDEMCGEEPYEAIFIGSGGGTKEKKFEGAVKKYNLEISPEYARICEGNIPNIHTIICDVMDSSANGILTPRVFEHIFGRPSGLKRKFINLGGFFGNPPLGAAINFVKRVAYLMQPGDEFLLGFDGSTDDELLEKIYGFKTERKEDPWEEWGVIPVSYGLTKLLKFNELSRQHLERKTTVTREGGHHIVRLKLDTSRHPPLQFQNPNDLGYLENYMRQIQAEFRNLNPQYLESRRTPVDVARALFFNECGLRMTRRKPGFEDQPFRAPDDNPYVRMGIDSFICRLVRA